MTTSPLFQKAVGLALFYTNFFDARYNRFADSVLGDKKNDPGRAKSAPGRGQGIPGHQHVGPGLRREKKGLYTMDLGFARTDALGLIGNRVFGPLNNENQSVVDARSTSPSCGTPPGSTGSSTTPRSGCPWCAISARPWAWEARQARRQEEGRFASRVNVKSLHLMESSSAAINRTRASGRRNGDTGLRPIDTQKRSRGQDPLPEPLPVLPPSPPR